VKIAHRQASHSKRAQMAPLPKFWRQKPALLPTLDASQQLDAKVIHWDLITRFTTGTATVVDLWDWMETGFTYSQIMRLLAEDGTEFTDESMLAIFEQMETYLPIVARYKATGRVGMNGLQLGIARTAATVMEGLIDMDRNGIAVEAALWSMAQVDKIKRELF
jgi:hypothetical protein